jgi:hypothetical protein
MWPDDIDVCVSYSVAVAACTGKQLKAYDQCGGKANCEGPQCVPGVSQLRLH